MNLPAYLESSNEKRKWIYPDSAEVREKYRRELKSEERRAVVWLGILAIVVAFDVYLRNNDTPEIFNKKFYNLFCSYPCAHVTFYWVPFLDSLIYFWIGYAICALVYFSEDILPGRRGTKVRRSFRRLGHILLAFLPVITGIYLLLELGSVNLPDYLQTPEVFAVSYLLGQFFIWVFEAATGKKILGERSIFRKPIDALLEVSREGGQIIAEAGPIRAKRALLIYLSAIELVVLLFAYFVLNLSGFDLLDAFGVPLYGFVIAFAMIGWYNRRKQKLKDTPKS